MKTPSLKIALSALTVLLSCTITSAETVAQFAASLRPPPNGGFYARFRMQIVDQKEKQTLQLHMKGRNVGDKNELLCQVIYPKNRKGEGVLIRRKNGRFLSAALADASGRVKQLSKQELKRPLFGSAMCLEDLNQSFFEWPNQRQRGVAAIRKTPCIVMESRPPNNPSPIYGLIVSWIDSAKRVAIRIEKFAPNKKLVRVIVADKVVKLRNGRYGVKRFTVSTPTSARTTILEGVSHKIVEYGNSSFTLDALKHVSAP